MTLVGLTLARNEEWILGLSLRAALMWLDAVVVLNHASTDRTADIIADIDRENPDRLVVLEEPEGTWTEMAHRQRCLEAARKIGGTHMVYIDADEILTGNLLDRIGGKIESLRPQDQLNVPWLHLWRGIDQFREKDGSVQANSWVTVAWQDRSGYHWEARKGYDFHQRDPMGPRGYAIKWPPVWNEGGIMHLQHVRWRHLLAKQALYKMTEVIRWPGRDSVMAVDRRYNYAVGEWNLNTSPVPAEWWKPYEHLMQYLDVDETREPWQEKVCKQMWEQYGEKRFRGLDLFEIVGQSVAA